MYIYTKLLLSAYTNVFAHRGLGRLASEFFLDGTAGRGRTLEESPSASSVLSSATGVVAGGSWSRGLIGLSGDCWRCPSSSGAKNKEFDNETILKAILYLTSYIDNKCLQISLHTESWREEGLTFAGPSCL